MTVTSGRGQAGKRPDREQASGRGLRPLARDVSRRLRRHDLWLYAAGLTFYTSIAAVPLLLLCLSFAGLVIGQDAVATLSARLTSYLPQAVRGVVELGITQEMDMRLGGAALVAASITASSYGEGLARVFDLLVDRPLGARAVRGRVLGLVLLFALQVATLGALVAVRILPDVLGIGLGAQALGTYLTFLVGWGLSTPVIALMYRLFPSRRLGFAAVVWAAAAAGSFFTGMSMGWLLALRFGVDVGIAFGGSAIVGTVVLASVYFFAVQLVLIVGYVLALELDDREGHPLRAPEGR